MTIKYENSLSEYYKTNFEHAAHLAYKDLLNCKHPALFEKDGTSKVVNKRLDILNFRIQSSEYIFNRPVCAYTTLQNLQNIIWLSKDEPMYWRGECRFTHVIEHEMLHLLGFDHSPKMREILRECGQFYELD